MPDQLAQLAQLFTNVILPILIMIGMGMLLQRFYPLHMPTLSRLNIYLLVPSFLFINVYESLLTWREIGGIAAAVVIPMLVIGVPAFGVMRKAKAAPGTIASLIVASVIFNAGNYGIPVASLHYGDPGKACRRWWCW